MTRRPPSPAPPFMVQAEREKKQHGVSYVTDSRHDDLPAAIAGARVLHEQFGRRVRVQDQMETVWFRLPAPAATKGPRQ